MIGTIVERVRRLIGRQPRRVWQAWQNVRGVNDFDLIVADLCEFASVFESCESNDPSDVIRVEGRRETVFFMLDRIGIDGRDVLEIQRRIAEQGEIGV